MSKRRLIRIHMRCGLDCYYQTIRATPVRVKEFPQVQLAIHQAVLKAGFSVTDITSGYEVGWAHTWGGAINHAKKRMLLNCSARGCSWRELVRRRKRFFNRLYKQ